MNEQNEFIKNYLHTEYVGCLKTDHEKCIDLQYEEIGNFVQNAGMFGDLEISIKHNGLVLFDTNGIYTFYRNKDIFSRQITRDDAQSYTRVCVHTEGYSNVIFKNIEYPDSVCFIYILYKIRKILNKCKLHLVLI